MDGRTDNEQYKDHRQGGCVRKELQAREGRERQHDHRDRDHRHPQPARQKRIVRQKRLECARDRVSNNYAIAQHSAERAADQKDRRHDVANL